MSTLEGRPDTALLVIDAQNATLAAGAGRDGVVANIGGLVARARAGGVPVIWIQHAEILAGHGIGRLVVAGAQTDACIRATIHGAFVRGYDVTLVSDAHTTDDRSAYGGPPAGQIIALTNLYWSYQSAPGRTAEVVPAAEVAFTPPAEFSRLTGSEQPGEMPLSGIRWQRER
jgi:hypothetical protein